MYFNTTNLQGKELIEATKKASTQEQIVLNIFKKHKKLTASEVFKHFGSVSSPITSIRRAMSNLQTKGYLQRLTEKKIGIYNAPEHYYKIV